MWNSQTLSVILPTFNEKDSIRQAIDDLHATGVVDEILVINNNAAAGTSEEVNRTVAREIHEPRQGYGFALRRGMAEATGELIAFSEPDGTFVGKDLLKQLAYLDDGYDVVFGTRTTKGFIWDGANMGLAMKYGNFLVSKVIELGFTSNCQFTDVGCTMRVMRRPVLEYLLPRFEIGGSHFGLEFMVRVLTSKFDYIEVPVNYLPRVGQSMVTGNWPKTFALALRMTLYAGKHRLRTLVPGWEQRGAAPDAE